jgi:hypothetical protein
MKQLWLVWVGVLTLFITDCRHEKKFGSLVPESASKAPDYFCTWNVQGYISNYSANEAQRQAMNERNIFGDSLYQNWIGLFGKLHKDLYFVLDDSWDVPLDGNKDYFGSLIVDTGRFPLVKGMKPGKALERLSEKIKGQGWKGVGLWICAQQAPKYRTKDSLAYWKERLGWMNTAGIAYWKVDWGENQYNAAWRLSLTGLAKEYAPQLIVEHALTPSVIKSSDVYRTYDVENVIAVPHTIDRIAKLLSYGSGGQAPSIINCEDEPYIAAGLGCAIAIERHPFRDKLPNGMQDFVFPPVGRDLKNRLDEVVRCVRWHRIASPFPIGEMGCAIDSSKLTDYWVMGKQETWMSNRPEGSVNSWQAPAIVTRGLPKPLVSVTAGEPTPYILASRYPNGAVAIASIGRTIKREYVSARAEVVLTVDVLNGPLGIFGHYRQLTLRTAGSLHGYTVVAQDLAGDVPVDITNRIVIKGGDLVIPGAVIDEIGLSAATKGDKSEPGLVLIIKK